MQKLYTLAFRFVQNSRRDPEIIRYIIVGVASNTAGYLLYLVLTILFGIGHKTAMSGLYAIGSIINFYANRQWTFRAKGTVGLGMVRFILAIVLGYFINLLGLFLFVDLVGWPHELVQGGAIVVMSVYFFLINKFFVHTA
jgi:putative flippase GtrA